MSQKVLVRWSPRKKQYVSSSSAWDGKKVAIVVLLATAVGAVLYGLHERRGVQ